MSPTALLQLVPALWRDRLYGAYVLVGLILGAVQAGFAAAPDAGLPGWFAPALAVYGYLAILFVGMAKANTTALSGPPPAPADPPVIDQQGRHEGPPEAGAADPRWVWAVVGILVLLLLLALLF